MSKDRAAPFSRKHRRYWIPILGGMILIGVLNLIIGFVSYDPPPTGTEKIQLDIPKLDAGAPADAGVDAGADAATPPR